jgi:hypothetical protein
LALKVSQVSKGLPEYRDLLVLAVNKGNWAVREFKDRLALRV